MSLDFLIEHSNEILLYFVLSFAADNEWFRGHNELNHLGAAAGGWMGVDLSLSHMTLSVGLQLFSATIPRVWHKNAIRKLDDVTLLVETLGRLLNYSSGSYVCLCIVIQTACIINRLSCLDWQLNGAERWTACRSLLSELKFDTTPEKRRKS